MTCRGVVPWRVAGSCRALFRGHAAPAFSLGRRTGTRPAPIAPERAAFLAMKYFRPFRFDEASRSLWRAGQVAPLTKKAGDLLAYFLEHPGEPLSHQQIMKHVWPDTHVQAQNIKTLVHEVRNALGDDPHQPTFIRADPGRGYTFIADATQAPVPLCARDDEDRSAVLGRPRSRGPGARAVPDARRQRLGSAAGPDRGRARLGQDGALYAHRRAGTHAVQREDFPGPVARRPRRCRVLRRAQRCDGAPGAAVSDPRDVAGRDARAVLAAAHAIDRARRTAPAIDRRRSAGRAHRPRAGAGARRALAGRAARARARGSAVGRSRRDRVAPRDGPPARAEPAPDDRDVLPRRRPARGGSARSARPHPRIRTLRSRDAARAARRARQSTTTSSADSARSSPGSSRRRWIRRRVATRC